jgi:hypothetical protein
MTTVATTRIGLGFGVVRLAIRLALRILRRLAISRGRSGAIAFGGLCGGCFPITESGGGATAMLVLIDTSFVGRHDIALLLFLTAWIAQNTADGREKTSNVNI